jgi:hypothetical protein
LAGFLLFVGALALETGVRAQSQSQPAKLAGVTPAHDPADIPFRRAPMGPSSRSIVVSPATNLHLAFDARLLRTHTVWEGAPLNLYGPPFNNTATRFICEFSGAPLWENLPTRPWEIARAEGGFETVKSRFRGVSTRNGQTGFLYELFPASGASVQVTETPRLERLQARAAVVRRVRVSPHDATLRWVAFHISGELVPLSGR